MAAIIYANYASYDYLKFWVGVPLARFLPFLDNFKKGTPV